MTKAVLILQEKLTTEPILVLPNMNEPFQIETDASGYGVGAVLTQEKENCSMPVAYFSRRLSKSERNYSVSERELYAIVLAVEYFRQFIYGTKFNIITDHKPLQYLLTAKELSSKLLRWINRLGHYEYNIIYRKGKQNIVADSLSRLPTEENEDENRDDEGPIIINLINVESCEEEPVIINVIVAENDDLDSQQRDDDDLLWIFTLKQEAYKQNVYRINLTEEDLKTKDQRSLYKQWNKIYVIKGKLYRAWTMKTNGSNQLIFQFIVPKKNRRIVMEKAHDIPISGHGGVNRTQNRIRERFYWPSWEQEVRDYVLSCDICQRNKAINHTPNAPLTIIESNYPYQIIQCDIAGEFNQSNLGNKWFLVIVDHFSKWADVHPMPNAKADTVAHYIVKTILRYGIPDQILTDQGANFQADMLQHVYDLLDIYKTRTTPYHPQADGGSEVFIRQFKQMITCFIEQTDNQKDWDEKIPFLVYAYNTATHTTTCFSPFELFMGRSQKLPIDLFDDTVIKDIPSNNHEYVEKLNNNFTAAYKLVKENRSYIMQKAKLRHDRHIAGCNFNKGDKVWLLIQSRKKGITSSIAPKHNGPYTILEVLNNNANYIIKQDNKRSRAKTVNRNQLRLCRSRVDTNYKTKPQITIDTSNVDIKNETEARKSIEKQKVEKPANDDNSKKRRGRPRKTVNSNTTDTADQTTNNQVTQPLINEKQNIINEDEPVNSRYQLRKAKRLVTYPK